MAKYEEVPLADLTVDPRYQRDIDMRHVDRLVKEFDPALVGVLEVSRREDGTNVIFDGQHRQEILTKAGEVFAPCIVHTGLTPEQEAELFRRLQDGRKALTPLDRFKARLFAGDPVAKGIQEISLQHDVEVGTGPGSLQAIVAAERCYRRDNLADTLGMLSIWRGDKGWLDGPMLDGLSRFLDLFSEADRDHATERWEEVSPVKVMRRAEDFIKGGTNKSSGVLEVLRDLYTSRQWPLPTVATALAERQEIQSAEGRRYRRVTLEEVRDAAVELGIFTVPEIMAKLSVGRSPLTKVGGFLPRLVEMEVLERKRDGSHGAFRYHYVKPIDRPHAAGPPSSDSGRRMGGAPVPGTGKPMTRPGGANLLVKRTQARGKRVVQRKK